MSENNSTFFEEARKRAEAAFNERSIIHAEFEFGKAQGRLETVSEMLENGYTEDQIESILNSRPENNADRKPTVKEPTADEQDARTMAEAFFIEHNKHDKSEGISEGEAKIFVKMLDSGYTLEQIEQILNSINVQNNNNEPKIDLCTAAAFSRIVDEINKNTEEASAALAAKKAELSEIMRGHGCSEKQIDRILNG